MPSVVGWIPPGDGVPSGLSNTLTSTLAGNNWLHLGRYEVRWDSPNCPPPQLNRGTVKVINAGVAVWHFVWGGRLVAFAMHCSRSPPPPYKNRVGRLCLQWVLWTKHHRMPLLRCQGFVRDFTLEGGVYSSRIGLGVGWHCTLNPLLHATSTKPCRYPTQPSVALMMREPLQAIGARVGWHWVLSGCCAEGFRFNGS